jgi:capsule polysaccharide export protein KpsE/RkpR
MARPNRQGFFEGPAVVRPEATEAQPAALRAQEDWLWLLWENRNRLWRWTLRGLLLSTLIAFLIPTRYQSATRLMPPDNSSNSGMAMLAALAGGGHGGGDSSSSSGPSTGLGNLGMVAGDMLGLKSTDAIWIGILRSDTLQDRLINRFDLRKIYHVRYMSDARKELDGNTDVVEDRKSGILTIKVIDRNRERSTAIARAYIDELNKLVAQLSTSSARREREFIEGRLQSAKLELDQASQQFSEYSSKNTAVDISAQEKAMVESAATLQGQMIAAQSELEGLQQIYTDNNIRVRTLRARIGELRRQLGMLGGQDDSSPQSGNDNSRAQDNDQLYPSIKKLPLLGVRWADLYRQTKMQEMVYGLLRQRYEMAKIEEAKEIPTVRVLDEAAVPDKKDSPHRLIIILICTALTFVVAAVWIVGDRYWQSVDPQHPRKLLLSTAFEHARHRFHARVLPFYSRFRRRAPRSDNGPLDPD